MQANRIEHTINHLSNTKHMGEMLPAASLAATALQPHMLAVYIKRTIGLCHSHFAKLEAILIIAGIG